MEIQRSRCWGGGEKGVSIFSVRDARYSFIIAPLVYVLHFHARGGVCLFQFVLVYLTPCVNTCPFILQNIQCLKGFLITYSVRL